jgi:CarboxypepD_reg-like domain
MNMKVIPLLFIICVSAAQAFAQATSTENITLHGKVLDMETNLPLAYVSIGVLNKSKGTVSDTLGQFTFSIGSDNFSDSLQFSIIGYHSLRVEVRDFIENADKSIRLTASVTQLPEVIFTSSSPRINSEVIGRQGSGKLTQVSIHNKTSTEETVGSEMGMLYKIDNDNTILKDFNFYISANNFNSIKFRINVYSVKNGLPDTLINKKQIFAILDNFKTGWTKIDLEEYNLIVRDGVIVTVQWVESRMEKKERPVTIVPVAMTLFSKNCYVRIASQDKWKRMGMSLSRYRCILNRKGYCQHAASQ